MVREQLVRELVVREQLVRRRLDWGRVGHGLLELTLRLRRFVTGRVPLPAVPRQTLHVIAFTSAVAGAAAATFLGAVDGGRTAPAGFVGALTAAHLTAHAPAGTRIAMAGRSAERLDAVRSRRGMDWPMLAATFAIAVGAALIAGLLPTWRACQVSPAIQLKSQ